MDQDGLGFSGISPSLRLQHHSDYVPAWQRIYCQACSRDITQFGGIVSTTGKVYCNQGSITGNNFCLDKELIPMVKEKSPKRYVSFHYLKPENMQKAIAEKRLVDFGPLELKV